MKVPLFFLKNAWGASYKHIYIFLQYPFGGISYTLPLLRFRFRFFCLFTHGQPHKDQSDPKKIFDFFNFQYTLADRRTDRQTYVFGGCTKFHLSKRTFSFKLRQLSQKTICKSIGLFQKTIFTILDNYSIAAVKYRYAGWQNLTLQYACIILSSGYLITWEINQILL